MMNDISRIRQAVRTAAYDEALAEHLGLNATDLRCLELLVAEPGVTPAISRSGRGSPREPSPASSTGSRRRATWSGDPTPPTGGA